MLEVKKYKNNALFEKSRVVSDDEFGKELDDFMSDMAETMYALQGVGLAASQVGDSRRMFVADISYVSGGIYGGKLLKMVNPLIISESNDYINAEEGCLSYPELNVNVSRPISVKVEYFSPYGERFVEEFNGWHARIIQHEIDHLEGQTIYLKTGKLKRKMYDKLIKRKYGGI